MKKYIWSEPDWPKFRWDDSKLGRTLADLRYKQGRFLGQMSALGFDLSQEALVRTLTNDVVQSSAIEGEVLNPQTVRASIARKLGLEKGDLGPGVLNEQERSVEGIVHVVVDATEKAHEPLTAERLFGWHGALFPSGRSGLRAITVAQWRGGPVHISDGNLDPLREKIYYVAPPYERVPHEMEKFLDWFNADTGEDPILKAGLAHYWFVAIHPFDDGNGRIGRAVTDMALARSDHAHKRYYSISSAIKMASDEYYKTLEATSNGDLDITQWQSFFIDRVDKSLDIAQSVIDHALAKARFWDQHRSKGISPRQQFVINRLLDGFQGKMTSEKWAKLIKSSQDTAGRDILDLVQKGVLQRSASGGRSTNYELILPKDSGDANTTPSMIITAPAPNADRSYPDLQSAFQAIIESEFDSNHPDILIDAGLIPAAGFSGNSNSGVLSRIAKRAVSRFSEKPQSQRQYLLSALDLPPELASEKPLSFGERLSDIDRLERADDMAGLRRLLATVAAENTSGVQLLAWAEASFSLSRLNVNSSEARMLRERAAFGYEKGLDASGEALDRPAWATLMKHYGDVLRISAEKDVGPEERREMRLRSASIYGLLIEQIEGDAHTPNLRASTHNAYGLTLMDLAKMDGPASERLEFAGAADEAFRKAASILGEGPGNDKSIRAVQGNIGELKKITEGIAANAEQGPNSSQGPEDDPQDDFSPSPDR